MDKENVVNRHSRILFHYKNNEIVLPETRWMDLKKIMLIEISQAQKDKCHIVSLKSGDKKVDLLEGESRIVIVRGWEELRWGLRMLDMSKKF
jgi:hypothetical protein